MAIYQGASITGTRLQVPARRPLAIDAPPARRAARLQERDQHGLRTMAIVLSVILTGTIFGLAYLTQTLHAASARSEIDALGQERQGLLRELQSQQATIRRGGSEAVVVRWAQGEGLDRLGVTIRFKAR